MKLDLVRNELDAVNCQLPLTSWKTRKIANSAMKMWKRLHCDLQKIIALCNCKYCFKIRIIYIIIVYIARVKASVNGNSIRNAFTDCIHEIYIVPVYVLA